jgi:tyrosyl-tRNA synthetase
VEKPGVCSNAVSLDGEKVQDMNYEVAGETVIKVGKRRFVKVVQ